ncbi:39S ribosomal protein L52, mitochondrial [Trichogramma pretiosum]|uniref:39S ribosomal protein L52, mitochondrial n=1 Tax=Trichogramma pretiosum TaxID=7493 RepID=UPI0006C9BDBF|nr:39S ribosomal protein L52, mitochondrial [Trichogramma pretiosum]
MSITNSVLLRCCQFGYQQIRTKYIKKARAGLNVEWRIQNKKTINPNSFGPLTNLPDYSFKDGRVVPYGTNQLRRIEEQAKIYNRVYQLSGEMDAAVEKYNKKQEAIKRLEEKIIAGKLKEKGKVKLVNA